MENDDKYYLLRFYNSKFLKKYKFILFFFGVVILEVLLFKFIGKGDRLSMTSTGPLNWEEIANKLPTILVEASIFTAVFYLFSRFIRNRDNNG
ncbi:MAG: hypothetical protein WD607_02590 [Candidatus Paceibacterota bacterium]